MAWRCCYVHGGVTWNHCAHCGHGNVAQSGLRGKVVLCVGRSDMGTLLSEGQSGKVLLCTWWGDMESLCALWTWERCSVQG